MGVRRDFDARARERVRRARCRRVGVLVACAALVTLTGAAVGCGKKDEPGPSSAATTAGAAAGSGAGSGSGSTIVGGPGTSAAPACGPSAISVSGDGTTAASDVGSATSYADIVGAPPGQSGTFTFANVDIASSDARGVLQPTGLQKGNAVVVVTISATTAIEPATYRDPQDGDAGDDKLIFFSIWTADGRALPTALHALTITSLPEGKVCGVVEPVAGSSGATAKGSFTAKRIDAGPTTKITSGSGGGSTTSTATR